MENTDASMPEKVLDNKDKVLPVKQRKHRKKQMYISLKKQMEFYLGKKLVRYFCSVYFHGILPIFRRC